MVDRWKYLGFYLSNKNNKLLFDPSEERKTFYRTSNCLINALYKPSEEVLMRLYFTNCVSVLLYGIEVKEYLARDMSNLHVAMNDGIRKIFGWNRWESVRSMRESFGYRDIYTLLQRSEGETSFPLFTFFAITYFKFVKHFCDAN